MRVLILNPVGAIGGGELSLIDVLTSLRRVRPDWEIRLIVGSPGPLAGAVRAIGVDVELLPFPAAVAALGDYGATRLGAIRRLGLTLPRLIAYAWRLRHLTRAFAPDVLYSNGIKMHLLTALMPRRIARVWHVRDFMGARPLVRRLMRFPGVAPSHAVAISEAVRSDLEGVLGAERITVVPNAIDVARYCPNELDAAVSAAVLDRLAGFGVDPACTPVRIGLVATFAHWKGHEVFLAAAAQLLQQRRADQLRFYVVGGPIYDSRDSQLDISSLKARAESLGITAQVGFTGHIENPLLAYRGLDIVVHASTRPEPFGRVIAEAMATGKAVVATDQAGAVELPGVRDVVGFYPMGNPEELARALRPLIEDRSLRQAIGGRAATVAQTVFSRDRLGPAMALILESVRRA